MEQLSLFPSSTSSVADSEPGSASSKPASTATILERFQAHLKTGQSAHTARTYAAAIRKLDAHLRHTGKTALSAGLGDLENYFANSGNIKTKELEMSAFRRFYAWAKSLRWIRENPARKLPFVWAPPLMPALIRKKDYALIKEAAQGEPEVFCLVMLFAEGGLKPGETRLLTLRDFDFSRTPKTVVSVCRERTRVRRTVEFEADFKPAFDRLVRLKGWSAGGADYGQPVFGYSNQNLNKKFKKLNQDFKFKNGELTPANLRHFCERRLLEAGKTVHEIRQFLGLVPIEFSPARYTWYDNLKNIPI